MAYSNSVMYGGVRIAYLAFALVVVSSVAGAQGQPVNFTVPFPSATKLQTILQYSTRVGNALSAEQSGEVDVPIGSRVVVMATTDVAVEHFGTFEGAVSSRRWSMPCGSTDGIWP